MTNKISIIIAREFSERVAKKSFIITTLLMPVLMVALCMLPALIMMFSTPSEKTIAVSDPSGLLFPALNQAQIDHVHFRDMPEAGVEALAADSVDAVLLVDTTLVSTPSLTLFSYEPVGLDNERAIASVAKNVVETQRLKSYNIENLPEILNEIQANVDLKTVKLDEAGEEEEISSGASFALGIVMSGILYLFLLMYGQIVMASIIDEKSNRVLELVVSSVKPFELMMGKVLGVGLVAVVQLIIWCVLLCAISALCLPMLSQAMTSPEGLEAMEMSPDQANPILSLLEPGAILSTFGYMIVYLVGGFLFFASIFAAIGSAVSNIQDAAQLQSFATLPIMLGFIFSITIGRDPMSPLGTVLSIIPFTSPMVMLARIPFGVPTWEMLTSIAILYLSFVAMAWLAGKIYRVGIFMYGRKPSVRDLIRWARYK